MTATARRTDTASDGGVRPRLAVLVTVLAAVLLLPAPAPASTARKSRPSALPAFSSCPALLSYARRNARRTGGRTGVPTRAGAFETQVLSAPGPVAREDAASSTPGQAGVPAPPPAAAGSPGRAAPSFSSTNVQEAGVDEPDIVKTDGRRVFAIANGRLHALDASGDAPVLVGTLELDGFGHQLLIRGDRVLVMTASSGGSASASSRSPVAFQGATVVLTEVDVSDPRAMAVRRTMQLDGSLVDARLTGATARVVVASSPDPVAPRAISRTAVRSFVPRTTLRSRVTNRTIRRSVVGCGSVRHPRQFSGLDLLTVLSIDLDKGLFDVDRDAIMAGAQTVYGSPTSLYVASQRYVRALESGSALPQSMRTEIHRFDASQQGQTSYAASGAVTGYVLNQYSLSEHDGALRVASTEEPQWFEGTQTRDSESFVTVLGATGLAPLGRVDGLGRGERIYAVRFVGDKGFVVTFRQVDPLYTLDLSDKANPKVLGELKILGYSAYLHPVSDDLLLGVGQDASAQGRTLGTQLSLFDVSDLRRPQRRAQASLGLGSSSQAEFDPHAFLFWKPTGLAVIPLSSYGRSDGRQTFQGVVGFRVGAASLAEAGRVAHPAAPDLEGFAPPIGRSLVIGERLHTLSFEGFGTSRLDTLAPLAFAPFPAPAQTGPPRPGPVPLPPPAVP